MIYEEPRFLPAGDRYTLIEFGNEMNLDLNFRAIELARKLEEDALDGFVEAVPAFASLLVHHDPRSLDRGRLIDAATRILASLGAVNDIELSSRLFDIPVAYADPWTRECVADYCAKIKEIEPNPEFVARVNGLSGVAELVRVHSGTQYWVAAIGFWPGLPFLFTLDPRSLLTVPKYNPPRTWTPQGAIGLGGSSGSIYPVNTPGGYQLLGRTPVPIWDLHQRASVFRDSIVLFRTGDRIKFRPISVEEFTEIEARVADGSYEYNVVEYEKFSVREYKRWVASLDPARRF